MLDTNTVQQVVSIASSAGILGQYQGLVVAAVSLFSAIVGFFGHRSAAIFGKNTSK